MNSQIENIVIVLTILLAAIAAPVVTFMWWKEKRKRTALDEELSVAGEAGQRAVEIGKKLFGEKNALAAKVTQMEQRFRPVVDLDAECTALKDKIAVWTSEIAQLHAPYQEKKAVYDRLLREVAVFDEKLAFAEMGGAVSTGRRSVICDGTPQLRPSNVLDRSRQEVYYFSEG